MELLKTLAGQLHSSLGGFGETSTTSEHVDTGPDEATSLSQNQVIEHLQKISGGQFKGKRYCDSIIHLAKKFDMFNIIKDHHIRRICKEVSFVNKMLNVTYDIIFRQGLSRQEALSKMQKLRDRNNHRFIDSDSADQLYQKFQELSKQINDSQEEEPSQVAKLPQPRQLGGKTRKRRPSRATKKQLPPPTNAKHQGGSDDDDDDDDDEDEDEDEEQDDDGNMDKKVKNNLSEAQRKTVDKTFDMMEIVLICLSLLPLTGWVFDFPLLIYSLVKKKYTLAMITVLNWFIWVGWLFFGLWVNMGPAMKASYLGNQENLVKKSLLYPTRATSKVMSPFTMTTPVRIDGKSYLKDSVGNLFSAQIQNPTTIGVLSDEHKIVRRNDDEYEETLRQLKHSHHKKKIGPTDIM